MEIRKHGRNYKFYEIGNSNTPNGAGNYSIARNSYEKFLAGEVAKGKTYELHADGDKTTNCVYACYQWHKTFLPPELFAKIDQKHFFNSDSSASLEQRTSGAAGAIHKAGLTDNYITSRGFNNAKPEQQSKFLEEVLASVGKNGGSVLTWNINNVSKAFPKGRGGHVSVDNSFEEIRDANGKLIDIKFKIVGANSKSSMGVSTKEYSMVNDFLKAGNDISIATFKPEVLQMIAQKDKGNLDTVA